MARLLLLLVPTFAFADLQNARLNSVYPAGGQVGTAFDVTISGFEFEGITELHASKPGVTSVKLRSDAFRITIDKDVPLGIVDLRAVTARGLSNFRAFQIDAHPEHCETEPNDSAEQAIAFTIPATLNGRMDKETDVDFWKFSAKKGERLFLNFWGTRIDSPIDGTMAIVSATGRVLAYSGDYYGKDPFIDFTAPEDGTFYIKLWDFTYGGSINHFYRLMVTHGPHLDAFVPGPGPANADIPGTLYGRNLPGGKFAPKELQTSDGTLQMIPHTIKNLKDYSSLRADEAIRPSASSGETIALRLKDSNPLIVGLGTLPRISEVEPNNSFDTAQAIAINHEVVGLFAPTGDIDWYKFPLQKNQKIVVEVYSERQGAMPDAYLAGYDPNGKRIASFDDGNRNIGQIRFNTQTRDPKWEFTAPLDGIYAVQVRDLYYQQRGDIRFGYRLVVREPQPDYRLIVVPVHDTQPDSITLGQGGKAWFDVLAHRIDGFEEPIRIRAHDLPNGVTCKETVIGPGESHAPIVLNATANAANALVWPSVQGTALLGNRPLPRAARWGGLVWATVNTPGVARMTDHTMIAVRNPVPFVLDATTAVKTVAPGAKIPVVVTLHRAKDWNEPVQLAGYDLPTGVTIPLVTIPKGESSAKVEITLAGGMKPGTFTVLITGAGQVPKNYAVETDAAKRGANARVVYPADPITFTVSAAGK